MTTTWAAVGALTISAVLIVVLCFGDPKRRRAVGRTDQAMLPRHRRSLVALACLPGFGCALLGNPAAFMLWLGGCVLLGWACAAWMRYKL